MTKQETIQSYIMKINDHFEKIAEIETANLPNAVQNDVNRIKKINTAEIATAHEAQEWEDEIYHTWRLLYNVKKYNTLQEMIENLDNILNDLNEKIKKDANKALDLVNGTNPEGERYVLDLTESAKQQYKLAMTMAQLACQESNLTRIHIYHTIIRTSKKNDTTEWYINTANECINNVKYFLDLAIKTAEKAKSALEKRKN